MLTTTAVTSLVTLAAAILVPVIIKLILNAANKKF